MQNHPTPRNHMIRRILSFFAVSALILSHTACGSSQNGGAPLTGTDDESGYSSEGIYGAYEITLDHGPCGTESVTLLVGNDRSQSCVATYLYLPADQPDYSDECASISRKKNTLNIKRTINGISDDCTVIFNDDFTDGTITGTRTSGLQDVCTGPFKGTMKLITRTPVELSNAYIQYRSLANPEMNYRAVRGGLKKNGETIEALDVKDLRLFQVSEEGDLLMGGAQSPYYFAKGDVLEGSCENNESSVVVNTVPSAWSGISFRSGQILTEGHYILAARVMEGDKEYTVTRKILYPGDSLSPVPAGLSAEWAENGLLLSWNPTEGDFDSLSVDLAQQNQSGVSDSLLSVSLSSRATTRLTLPFSVMANLASSPKRDTGYGVLCFQVKTAKKTEEGMIYACGISRPFVIPDSDSWKNVDNRNFYGAYRLAMIQGDCPATEKSMVVGNDSSKVGWTDYLYLPEFAVTHSASGVTVRRSGRNTLSLTFEHESSSQMIRMVFSDDGQTAVLSGTSSEGSSCPGPLTGQMSVITRQPAVIDFTSIVQLSDLEAEICIALLKDGAPVSRAGLSGFSIFNPDQTLLHSYSVIDADYESRRFVTSRYQNGSFGPFTDEAWAGIRRAVSVPALPGLYTFTAQISENGSVYPVSGKVYFPGHSEPVQRVTDSLYARKNDEGLLLEWNLPESIAFDDMLVSVIKTETEKKPEYLLTLGVNPQDGVERLVVPKNVTDRIFNTALPLKRGQEIRMEIRTRKCSSPGVAYAEGVTSVHVNGIAEPEKKR